MTKILNSYIIFYTKDQVPIEVCLNAFNENNDEKFTLDEFVEYAELKNIFIPSYYNLNCPENRTVLYDTCFESFYMCDRAGNENVEPLSSFFPGKFKIFEFPNIEVY